MISRSMAEFRVCWDDDDQALLTRTRQQHADLIANIRAEIQNSPPADSEYISKQSVLEEYESQLKTFDGAIRSLIDARDQNNSLQTNEQRQALQREIKRLQSRLPVYARRNEIIDAVRANRVLILKAQTGAGKSTQVVQYLVDAGLTDNGKK